MTYERRRQAQPHGTVASHAFLPRLPLPANMADGNVAISDMADGFGVTHRTLHFYEEKGLLSAERIGPMRVYGIEDIQRMAIINACREVEMPIAEVQDLMATLSGAESQQEADTIFARALQARRRELAAQQSLLRRQMQRLTELMESMSFDGGQNGTSPLQIHLSPIEQRCLIAMAEGYPATRIADLMGMDVVAVLTLESDIIRKFNGHNRFQAVAKAVLLGLISMD